MPKIVGNDIAVLRDGATTFIARSVPHAPAVAKAPIILVQGIYQHSPAQARRILRHRIFTTVPSSASIQGMVKVAAKRITTDLSPTDPPFSSSSPHIITLKAEDLPFPNSASPIPGSLPANSDDDFMSQAFQLASQVQRQGSLFECDRPIAALLVSKENEILAAAVNTNAKNRTLHAEINLIRAYHQKSNRTIPPHSRIYTTLKPCRMCAAMIWDCCEKVETIQVIYGEGDLGTNARHTQLDLSPIPIQRQLGQFHKRY